MTTIALLSMLGVLAVLFTLKMDMATFIPGALISDVRGKVGGIVFARNKGGMYIRTKVKPTNPKSVAQQLRRSNLSAAAALWGTATAQNRADWQAYALNTNWSNRLGASINIGGEAAFIRHNALLLLGGIEPNLTPPAEYGKAAAVVTSITASAAAQTIEIALPSEGFDPAANGNRIWLFAAMPLPASRDMAPIRYRYLQVIIGNAGGPEGFPFTTNTVPWSFTAGQRMTLAIVPMDIYLRVGIRSTFSCICDA